MKKVRAWDKLNKEMKKVIQVSYSKDNDEISEIVTENGEILRDFDVMHSIGLVDSHGNDVFEKDVVDVWISIQDGIEEDTVIKEYVLDDYDDVVELCYRCIMDNRIYKMEITGDVYQNPETWIC